MKRTALTVVTFAVLGFGGAAFADRQPHMARALELLEKAEHQLKEATHDKGGHRAKALEHVKAAIGEVNAGMDFDDKH